MAVLYALLAAASWGAADFLGGLLGRRTKPLAVAFAAALTGFVLLAGLVLLTGGEPTARDLWWGAAAGLGGGAGVALLYRGLAVGRMALVAPVTAVGAALLPVAWGLARGERPGLVVGLGALLALVAVALVSWESAELDDADATAIGAAQPTAKSRLAPGLVEAVGSGIGFGTFFILIDQVSSSAGLWPLVPMRAASVLLMLVVAAIVRVDVRPPRALWWPILAVGTLDTIASTLYLLATRVGLLSLVAVLGSLYPAGTVLLARAVLRERIGPVQAVGLLLAAVAVTLITVG